MKLTHFCTCDYENGMCEGMNRYLEEECLEIEVYLLMTCLLVQCTILIPMPIILIQQSSLNILLYLYTYFEVMYTFEWQVTLQKTQNVHDVKS